MVCLGFEPMGHRMVAADETAEQWRPLEEVEFSAEMSKVPFPNSNSQFNSVFELNATLSINPPTP